MMEDSPEPSGSKDLGIVSLSPLPSMRLSPPPSMRLSPPPPMGSPPPSLDPSMTMGSSPSLVSVCSICSSPAASHLHYGAVCCYSCRAFFRRGIPENKKCIYNTNNCHINQFNRTNCKKCRYERCLKFGMKPQLVGAVLKKKQERASHDTKINAAEGTRPINLSTSEEQDDKPAKKYFAMEEFLDNSSDFVQTIVPNGCGGVESLLTAKKDFIKEESQRQKYPFQNIPSSKSIELPYIEQQSSRLSLQPSSQITERKQFINKIDLENSDLPFGNRILENTTKRHWIETVNREKQEKMFRRDQRPIISAYDRLKQDAYFENRKQDAYFENRMRETITSQNHRETIPTFFSSKQHLNPNILDVDENPKHSQNKINSLAKPPMPTVLMRNTENLINEAARPASIIKYVGTKYDTNLENVLSIPTFDNLMENNSTFKSQIKKTELLEVDTKDTELISKNEEEVEAKSEGLENDSGTMQQQLISDSDEPLIPLKKRSRMHECYYPITHAINRRVMPVMPITYEEEFSIVDIQVRIQKYITMQHGFMKKTLGNNLLTTKWVNAIKYGHKMPYNQEEEKHLFDLATMLIKAKGVETFPDLKHINNTVRNIMLHSTIPTLWVLYLSVIEAHKNSSSGMDQVKQILYFTKDLYGNNEQKVLTSIPGMSYKDMERFTSPWAENSSDEQKFDRTLSQVGGIIAKDIKLHALYHMLVMCIPSKKTPDRLRNDRTLCELQSGLVGLTYKYLANKTGWPTEKADQTVQLLLHLVDELHDCADIMYNRSLVIQ